MSGSGKRSMRRSFGFSLVELMVAVALALFVSAAVISVFVGSRSAYQATSGTAALTDGGRFALDFLQSAVRSAGFMACSRSVSSTTMLSAADPFLVNFGEAMGGFEANNTNPAAGGAYTVTAGTPATPVTPDSNNGDWATPGLDTALTGLVVQGNDVLVVRSSLQNAQPAYVLSGADGAGANFNVTTQAGAPQPVSAGQFAVVSDCAYSLAMLVTGVTATPPTYQITHNAGGGGPVTNTTASLLPMSFQPGSEVTPVDTVVYYIGRGQDGDSALFAADLYDPATNAFTGALQPKELVPDIEAMQVLYGVAENSSQNVSKYVTADGVTEFNNVMSIKVAVLAASAPGAISPPAVAPVYQLLGTAVTAPTDSRSRQVFEMTIAVRNSLN